MKKYFFAALFIVLIQVKFSFAQTTNCFDIESILVDACGTPEGENEMVRFLIGPNPLNTSSLIVDWPNNNWLGVTQDAQTAGIVDTLNQSIQACGYIVEPPAGVIPANAEVILVTSSNMNITANSFANLADTLYMVFQTAGNTSGHFKNYSLGSGTRTLIMNFGACADTVTYAVDSLIDQSGLHAAQDGATVVFNFAGNDTYTNPGCQAPIIPLGATVTANSTLVCAGDTVSLLASNLTGNYLSYFWTTNGAGTFSSTTNLSTIYQTVSTSSGTDIISFGMIGLCGDTAYSTVSITYAIGVPISINVNPDTVICNGNSVTLTGVGGTSYLWSTGATTDSIVVTTAGYYTVTSQNACGNFIAGVNIVVNTTPNVVITPSGPTTFCQGQSVTLTASGGSPYIWSNGATTASITINASGSYTVTSSNSCGSSSATEIVTVNALPAAQITSPSLTFCQGSSTTLTASGGISFLWSTGATTSAITVNTAGTFTVTVTNSCGSSSTSVTTQVTTQPVATIIPSGPTTFCQGQSVTLTASGGASYQWSTGVTTAVISVTTSGIFTVTVTDLCGTSSASVSTTVTNLPSAAITASGPTTFCIGGSVTLTASGGGNYLWSTGVTTASIVATTSATYSVTVNNTCGSSTASSTVLVDTIVPSATITPNGPTSFCDGTSITLQGTGTGNFQWSTGSVASSISVNTSGTYFLTATNACGTDNDSIVISVYTVNAVATASPATGAPPLQVNFSSSQSTNASQTWWSFSVTDTSTQANPSFTFANAGNYTIQLIVTNQQGCKDTAYVDIDVNSDQPFFIPNIFTPNDDKSNDLFYVVGSDVKNVTGTIFNRWGNEIINVNSNNGAWNGKNKNGKECAEGVYYYVLVVNFKNNVPLVEKRGTITLLR